MCGTGFPSHLPLWPQRFRGHLWTVDTLVGPNRELSPRLRVCPVQGPQEGTGCFPAAFSPRHSA